MEGVRQTHVTRLLTDEYDLYYDKIDMFARACEGEIWTEYWMCGHNRTLQVGDTVFFLDLPYRSWEDLEKELPEAYPKRGFFARGHLMAAEADEQLRQLDGEAYGDLSAAYCNNAWREENLDEIREGEKEEILFVRFKLDSIVDLESVLPITWLQQQPGCNDLFEHAPFSGESIPAEIGAALNDYWERHVSKQEAESLGLRSISL